VGWANASSPSRSVHGALAAFGIMNVMLARWTDRTTRSAYAVDGSRRRDILMQFMVESVWPGRRCLGILSAI